MIKIKYNQTHANSEMELKANAQPNTGIQLNIYSAEETKKRTVKC